jgi:hypothetical protein
MARKAAALAIVAIVAGVCVAAAETGTDGFRRGVVPADASHGNGVVVPNGFPIADPHGWRSRLPRLDGAAAPAVRFKLDEAYSLVVRALREQPSCAALFDRFSFGGEEALAGTEYRSDGEASTCLRPALAFTCVGCRQPVLCSGFLHLGTSAEATTLIHEALHFGGLRESPPFPGAMSSAEISAAVERSCHP